MTDQPPPKEAPGPDCWLLVIDDLEDWYPEDTVVKADMEERRRVGMERYGMPVRPGNGRNPLVDGWQELLDAAVYLRQAIEEGHPLATVYFALLGLMVKMRKKMEGKQ